MTNPTDISIPDHAIGQTLRAVSALELDIPGDGGPPMREAICLHFDSLAITFQALTDTSELCVNINALSIPDDPELADFYSVVDISNHELFPPIIGNAMRNWWLLTNDGGYHDGYMVAFYPHEAVCFIAMNNEVSILRVSGEQCS